MVLEGEALLMVPVSTNFDSWDSTRNRRSHAPSTGLVNQWST